MNIYVGIDPSINSTGMCMQFYSDEGVKICDDKFFIVKGGKLTKKEKQAEADNIDVFRYILYDKVETKTSDDNHEFEYIKTTNFIKIVNCVFEELVRAINSASEPVLNIWICQEGISYGSTIKTKSVFDLAGLNYMLRMKFMTSGHDNIKYIIATPGEMKKFATGAGNANKELIINVFQSIYPELNLPKIDDIADAYFMASYSRHLFEKENF